MALNRNRPNRPKNYLAAAAGVIIRLFEGDTDKWNSIDTDCGLVIGFSREIAQARTRVILPCLIFSCRP
jgi:hypothetical protein